MSKKKISPEAQAILSAVDAGHYATTVLLVQRFLNSNPDSQRAWLDLGTAYGQLGKATEAEAAFAKVIELEQGDATSPPALAANSPMFGEIGNLYRNRGEFSSAKQWYEKQVAAAPQSATGHLYLGNLAMRQGQFEQAVESFQTALKCEDVCFEEAYYSLGLAYRSLDQFAAARDAFQNGLEYEPNHLEAKAALKDVKSAMTLAEQG